MLTDVQLIQRPLLPLPLPLPWQLFLLPWPHATSSSAHSTASAVASVAAALSSSPAKASDKAKNDASAAMMTCLNFPVSINKSSHPCGALTIPPK